MTPKLKAAKLLNKSIQNKTKMLLSRTSAVAYLQPMFRTAECASVSHLLVNKHTGSEAHNET